MLIGLGGKEEGGAAVVRDWQGMFVGAMARPIQEGAGPEMEDHAALLGVELLKRLGDMLFVMESDFQAVVQGFTDEAVDLFHLGNFSLLFQGLHKINLII